MQENQFSHFVNYFRQLQQKHKELQDFVHGTTNRIITKSRSELNYPCLWVETPAFKFGDNGSGCITAGKTSAFVVMANDNTNDPDGQDLLWAQTLAITFDVLSMLQQDDENRQFHINFNSVTIDPISTLTADNDYGWRVEFNLVKEVELCFDPSKWNLN